VDEDKKAKIKLLVVKLHAKAKVAFRFESNDIPHDLLSSLAELSDPVFFGYPYGLIEADRGARVTNEEKNYFKTLITAKSGFEEDIISHEILDKISF
jgi:hypothetical protein